ARHAAAVAMSFIPAVAALVLIQVSALLGPMGKSIADLTGPARSAVDTVLVVGNGFIVTALLWGWAVCRIIDRRLAAAAVVLCVAGVATLFGVIHSPLASGALFWPWSVASSMPFELAGAYGMAAAVLLLMDRWASAHGRAGGSPS